MQEIGSTGLVHSYGYIGEEWHPNLVGNKAVRYFQEMEDNCSVVGAWSALLEFLVRQAPIVVKASDDSDPAEGPRKLLEEVWKDMDQAPDVFTSEMITCGVYGHSLFEILYKIRRGPDHRSPLLRSDYSDGKIGIRGLAVRAQNTFDGWEIDEHGQILGVYQIAPPDYKRVFIPAAKFVLFRPRVRHNNPEGRSLLRSAARDWDYLKRHQEIEAIGAEKNTAGIPDMQVPLNLFTEENNPLRVKIEDMVVKIRRNKYAGVVRPAEKHSDGQDTGFKLGVLNSGGAKPTDMDTIVRRYESRILIALLAESQLLGMDNHGSFAIGDVKSNIVSMMVSAILKMACSALNDQVVPRWAELNGIDPADRPYFSHGDVETPDLSQMATFLGTLKAQNLIESTKLLARFLEQHANLPVGSLGLIEGDTPEVSSSDEKEESDDSDTAEPDEGSNDDEE